MILGIGTDITDIKRIEKLIKSSDSFIRKVFTDTEVELSASISDEKRRMGYFAKRFAAKEALAKALGTGIGASVSFRDMEITNDDAGKPIITIMGNIEKQIMKSVPDNMHYNIDISLSDEYPYAQAFVVISTY